MRKPLLKLWTEGASDESQVYLRLIEDKEQDIIMISCNHKGEKIDNLFWITNFMHEDKPCFPVLRLIPGISGKTPIKTDLQDKILVEAPKLQNQEEYFLKSIALHALKSFKNDNDEEEENLH